MQAAVEGATKSQKKEAKPESIETDIDKPSFAIAERIFGDNDVAVVIGIEGYQALPKSDYSYDDARLVKDYLKALGFKERNIEL
ncbi:MAG: caspase family protein, partial [Nitrospinae bacterium]|nr:caspase family protein [Nitrospinota bacterium]